MYKWVRAMFFKPLFFPQWMPKMKFIVSIYTCTSEVSFLPKNGRRTKRKRNMQLQLHLQVWLQNSRRRIYNVFMTESMIVTH